jgi:hypothetical protein
MYRPFLQGAAEKAWRRDGDRPPARITEISDWGDATHQPIDATLPFMMPAAATETRQPDPI